MKLLIRDYFERWGWAYTLVGLIHVIFCAYAVRAKGMDVFFFPYAAFASVLLLSMDLQRGGARATIALPIPVKQIARAWWLVSVGFPAIGVIVLGFLSAGFSAGLASLTHTPGEFYFSSVFFICLTNVLWLGSMYFLFSCVSGSYGSDWWSRTRAMFFGSLWGLSFGGWVFFAQYMSRSSSKAIIGLAVCGLFMSIAGWFRAEQLVLQRAGFRPASQRAGNRPAKYRISQGFNGIPLLITKVITDALLWGVYLVAFMAIMAFFQGGLTSLPKFVNSFMSMAGDGFPPFFFIVLFQIFPLASQLRLLRTLPLSTTSLAILLVLLPMVSTLTIGAGCVALALSTTDIERGLAITGSFLMLSAVAAACIPIVVWSGYRLPTKMILGLFIVIGGVTLVQLAGITLSLPICAVIWILTVAISCFLTKSAHTRSGNAYRTWPNPFSGGWNWGGS